MFIQSAGRVLSQANTSRLKALFTEIGSVLVDASVLSYEDLKQILDEQLGKTIDSAEAGSGIQAGKFADFIQQRTWQQAVGTAIETFRNQFFELYEMSDPQIIQVHGSGKERNAIALELLTDFGDFLKEKINTYPGFNDSVRIIPTAYMSPNFYASARTDESESVAVEASVREIDLTFNCELQEVVSAAGQTAAVPKALANRLPIEGILCYVDEVSEFAPARGSELPLFVPRNVGELAAQAINSSGGLPLDADDSLGKHANEEIVGIMTSAEIVGNEFWVKGHLFPWNNQKKVALISANSKTLGMSMNAHAKTQPKTIDGKKVTYITSLDILGANILYAEKATYQKTKTVMAPHIIAASKESNQEEEKSMELATQQLAAITDTLAALAKDSERNSNVLLQLQAVVNEQTNKINQQASEIRTLQAEKEQQEQAIAAARLEEAKKQEQQNLIAAMSLAIKEDREAFKQEILASLPTAGDRRRPPSRTTGGLVDIVAQGNNTNTISAQQLELNDAKSRLAALRQVGVVGPERAKLIEQISRIEAQMAS
ncbi:hypothetical protein FD723_39830 (plasmid) [Nostoc sp. C052]|uniref:hypothetical protein n=1 Tax=Nostoc sp. C052 TaxID=2576902 RepID=UPI0015C34EDF|nr:hypothetical protein [Nostoc sp. C052]QLE46363.1 hypothetical protein FD723_39830 [Nostoc sp. C052]